MTRGVCIYLGKRWQQDELWEEGRPCYALGYVLLGNLGNRQSWPCTSLHGNGVLLKFPAVVSFSRKCTLPHCNNCSEMVWGVALAPKFPRSKSNWPHLLDVLDQQNWSMETPPCNLEDLNDLLLMSTDSWIRHVQRSCGVHASTHQRWGGPTQY